MPPHHTSWISILILFSHLCLGLPSGLLPSGLSTKFCMQLRSCQILTKWEYDAVVQGCPTSTHTIRYGLSSGPHLISSWREVWIFRVLPKYLNCTTFLNDLLPVNMLWFFSYLLALVYDHILSYLNIYFHPHINIISISQKPKSSWFA